METLNAKLKLTIILPRGHKLQVHVYPTDASSGLWRFPLLDISALMSEQALNLLRKQENACDGVGLPFVDALNFARWVRDPGALFLDAVTPASLGKLRLVALCLEFATSAKTIPRKLALSHLGVPSAAWMGFTLEPRLNYEPEAKDLRVCLRAALLYSRYWISRHNVALDSWKGHIHPPLQLNWRNPAREAAVFEAILQLSR